VVSQNEKEFVYKELNIFLQTMPSSGDLQLVFNVTPDDVIVC
jgi:hypothetical protein